MQDREYKKMSNEGWTEMRTVLDREMPIKNNRRKLIWVIILLIGLGLMGYIAYPPISNTNSTQYVSEPHMDNNEANSHTEVATLEQPKAHIKPLYNNQKASTSTKIIKEHKALQENDAISNESSIVDNKSRALNLISNIDYTGKEENNVTAIVSQKNHKDKLHIVKYAPELVDITFMPELKVTALQNERSFLIPEISTPIAYNRKLHLSTYLGYALGFKNQVNGARGGFRLVYALNHHWSVSLGAGVMYNLHQLKLSSSNFEFSNNGDSFSPVTEATSGVNTGEAYEKYFNNTPSSYATVHQQILTSVYGEFPIGLSYRIKRSKFNIGMNYSRLLHATNGSRLEKTNAIFLDLFESSYETNYKDSGLLNKHLFGLYGAYSWQLNNIWSVELQANYGLNRIIQYSNNNRWSENRQHYIYAGVSMRLF